MEILRHLLEFLQFLLAGIATSIMVIIIGYSLYKLLFRNPSPRQKDFKQKTL